LKIIKLKSLTSRTKIKIEEFEILVFKNTKLADSF